MFLNYYVFDMKIKRLRAERGGKGGGKRGERQGRSRQREGRKKKAEGHPTKAAGERRPG